MTPRWLSTLSSGGRRGAEGGDAAPGAGADPVAPAGRSTRAMLTTVDQGIFSVSNFAVGVAVAHISGIVGLGGYSLAYALWLAFQALHRGLITDPMAIENDVRHPEARRLITAGLASELSLGLVATALFGAVGVALLLSGQHLFGVSLVALAPWLPVLLAQDYWRWIAFMQGRPGRAVANDVVFDSVQALLLVAMVLAGLRSPAVAICAWGAGAAAGAVLGLRQFGIGPSLRGGWAKMRHRWPVGRWLSANGVTAWGSSQSYAVLSAAILGPVGVGGLRAAQTLVGGVALVLLQSGSSLGLPEASRAFHDRGWAGLRSVTRLITTAAVAAVGLVALVVFVEGGPLLRFLYGPRFARYYPAAAVIAAGTVVTALALGAILTLKATRQSRALFVISTVQMAVTAAAIGALTPVWGTTGAAVGMTTGSVVGTTALVAAQLRLSRRALAGAPRADTVPAARLAVAPGPHGARGPLLADEALWLVPGAPAVAEATRGER